MSQTLFTLALTLGVGGVILSQRGKVTNEASVKAARAAGDKDVVRDKKKVDEPVYVKEEGESKSGRREVEVWRMSNLGRDRKRGKEAEGVEGDSGFALTMQRQNHHLYQK